MELSKQIKEYEQILIAAIARNSYRVNLIQTYLNKLKRKRYASNS